MSDATPTPRRPAAVRVLIWIGIVAAATALVVLGLRTVVDTIVNERTRTLIETRLTDALGLDVEIRGDFELRLLPSPRIRIGDLSVINPPGEPSPVLLQVRVLDLAFGLAELLKGNFEISALDVNGVEVYYDGELEALVTPGHPEVLADEDVEEELPFEIRSLDIQDVEIHYGEEEEGLWTLQVEKIELASKRFAGPLRVYVRGVFEGSVFELSGELGPLSQLAAPRTPFPVRLAGRLFEGDVAIDGHIARPLALEGFDLAIRAHLGDIGSLSGDPDRRLPPIGPADASARVVDRDGVIGLDDIEIALADPKVNGTLHGAIEDLVEGTGIHLELGVALDDLSLAEILLDRPLPALEPVIFSATLSDRDGSVGVTARASAGDDDGDIRITLHGSHGDLARLADLDVSFTIEARNLAALGKDLDLERELPPIGPVSVKGELEGEGGAIGLENLVFEVGTHDAIWAEGSGQVGNLADLAETEIEFRFGIEDLRDLGALIGGEPPDVGPIRGGALVTDRDGTLGFERVHAKGGQKDRFEIEVEGAFDDVNELDEITLEARIEARDLAVLGEVFGTDLPELGPLSFYGTVRGSNERLESSGEARIGATVFTGDWSGSFAHGARPRIDISVRSPRVRLRDVGIEPSDAQLLRALPPKRIREGAARWWAGDEELPVDWLRVVDGRLSLESERLTGRSGLLITDVQAIVELEDGDLVVKDVSGSYEGGSVEADLRIDGRTPTPQISMSGRLTQVNLNVLMAQFVEENRSSGIVDAAIDVKARGTTIDELRSSLGGRLQARFLEWAVVSMYMDRIIKDMITALIRSNDDDLDSIDCFAMDLDLDEGIAKVRSMVLESEEATVRGSGKIDLAKQRFDLSLTPEVHSPRLLSVAAKVYVKGPLDDPRFRSSTRSLATSVTRGLFYNVTRPARVLVDVVRGEWGSKRPFEAVCDPAGESISPRAPEPEP